MNVMALMDMTYGMYVISSRNADRDVGCFVNTVTQVTAENPILSVCINKKSFTNESIKKSKKFAVSILSEKTDSSVIGTFGFSSSRDVDKFESVKFNMVCGMPVLDEDICGYVICEVIDIVDAETHNIFLGRVIEAEKVLNNVPMSYAYYHKVIKGKAPKEASTYVDATEEIIEFDESMEESALNNEIRKSAFKCPLCGYVHDESKSTTMFADLPDDWKCPICGKAKSEFVKI